MNADISLCKQLQCGAIGQSDLPQGMLQSCVEGGYFGSWQAETCLSPDCAVYFAQMRARGTCPPVTSPIPTPTPIYVPTFPGAAQPVPIPAQALLRPLPQIVPSPSAEPVAKVCDSFTSWVATNPLLAVAGLAVIYFGLRGK